MNKFSIGLVVGKENIVISFEEDKGLGGFKIYGSDNYYGAKVWDRILTGEEANIVIENNKKFLSTNK